MVICEIAKLEKVIGYLLSSRAYLGKDPLIRVEGKELSRELVLNEKIKGLIKTREYFLSADSNKYIYRKKNADGSYTRYPPAKILLEEARSGIRDNQRTDNRHIIESEIAKSLPLTKRLNPCTDLYEVLNQKYLTTKQKRDNVLYGFSSVIGFTGFSDISGKEIIFLTFFKDPIEEIKASLSEKIKTDKMYHYLRSDSPSVHLYSVFIYKSAYDKLVAQCRMQVAQKQLNRMERPSSLNSDGEEVEQLTMKDTLEQALWGLDGAIDNIASESTASEVSDKMEFIREEISTMRRRLQEAKENNDMPKVKKICDNGIITLKKYYKEIEDIPETLWENVGMEILRNLVSIAKISISITSFVLAVKSNPIGIKEKVTMVGSGVSVLSNILSKLKESVDGIDYKKINDKYFGNKNRKGAGNLVKEKSLKMINDNILILQKVRNEI